MMATGVGVALSNLGQESVSFHTVDGRFVGEVPADAVMAVSWGRERREVTRAQIEIATEAAAEVLADVVPWVHHCTIWEDGIGVWTGPVLINDMRRERTTISARDPSTFMWRTRVPITKTWSSLEPAAIGADLWRLMAAVHRLPGDPVVLPKLSDSTFTIQAVADSRMLHALMDDLVKAGLQWTVVGGRAVFGDFPDDPIVELSDEDFNVEIGRRRDGTNTFNNIQVRGRNWTQVGRANLAGLNLQGMVSLDDMGGVGNIQKATARHVAEKAIIRDTLYLPPSASLTADAPVELSDLVPGKVFALYSGGVSQLAVLDAMNVDSTPESYNIQVTLEAVQIQTDIESAGGTMEGGVG